MSRILNILILVLAAGNGIVWFYGGEVPFLQRPPEELLVGEWQGTYQINQEVAAELKQAAETDEERETIDTDIAGYKSFGESFGLVKNTFNEDHSYTQSSAASSGTSGKWKIIETIGKTTTLEMAPENQIIQNHSIEFPTANELVFVIPKTEIFKYDGLLHLVLKRQ